MKLLKNILNLSLALLITATLQVHAITVTKAIYGASNYNPPVKSIDVTAQVKAITNSTTPASNTTFGFDPAAGIVKTLYITYSDGSTKSIGENNNIPLPTQAQAGTILNNSPWSINWGKYIAMQCGTPSNSNTNPVIQLLNSPLNQGQSTPYSNATSCTGSVYVGLNVAGGQYFRVDNVNITSGMGITIDNNVALNKLNVNNIPYSASGISALPMPAQALTSAEASALAAATAAITAANAAATTLNQTISNFNDYYPFQKGSLPPAILDSELARDLGSAMTAFTNANSALAAAKKLGTTNPTLNSAITTLISVVSTNIPLGSLSSAIVNANVANATLAQVTNPNAILLTAAQLRVNETNSLKQKAIAAGYSEPSK